MAHIFYSVSYEFSIRELSKIIQTKHKINLDNKLKPVCLKFLTKLVAKELQRTIAMLSKKVDINMLSFIWSSSLTY